MELIQRLARDNPLWGAERIRGELLKVGIRLAKRTVQKYLRSVRRSPPRGQTWATFLHNHLHQTWACDFLPTYDIWFRPLFAFFLVELGSRRVVSVGVTSNPSSTWVAQQLRNATAFRVGPRFIIRDRDNKFGADFDRAAQGVGARMLRTPVRAPKANAFCERFLGSVRRGCLDHVLILGERHLLETLREYARYFDRARTHQGIGQLVPAGFETAAVGRGRPRRDHRSARARRTPPRLSSSSVRSAWRMSEVAMTSSWSPGHLCDPSAKADTSPHATMKGLFGATLRGRLGRQVRETQRDTICRIAAARPGPLRLANPARIMRHGQDHT